MTLNFNVDTGAIEGFVKEESEQSASGTSVTFTGFRSGINFIVLTFSGVSVNGVGDIDIQIGDSGGIETTGYESTSVISGTGVQSSTGFVLYSNSATLAHHGMLILVLKDAANNEWASSHIMRVDTSDIIGGGGVKTLTTEITQLSCVPQSSGSFDAGTIGIRTW